MNDMAAKFTMTNITMTTICIEHTQTANGVNVDER